MSSGAGNRFPPLLTTPRAPTPDQLKEVMGPDLTVRRVIWDEDDERIQVRNPPFPMKRGVVSVGLMLAFMTATPIALSYMRCGTMVLTTVELAVLAVLWLVMPPIALALLRRARRRVDGLGPGAIVNKRTRELTLPWLQCTVAAERIDSFVDVIGRYHMRGAASYLRQCAVVYRDDADRFVVAPIARVGAPTLHKSCAARLADFYDAPLRELKGVVFDMGKR